MCILVPNLVHPCPDVSPTASRCTARCVATYRHLRRDADGGASGRSFGGIGRTVTCYVG